ncbi:ribonuclease H-like domain-containing protein [Tanacetum coccineum]|uniref:Ribonuclease H-like domain-containing protein n=1 Tax=Tanacetum coccineum TaxID=301880 RepID=A0ABQ5I8U0_9ASTR
MARSNDENPPPPPPQTSTQQAPHTVSTIKLHILKRGEYDIWAMKMEHYLSHTDYPIWEVIQKGNGPVNVSTDTNGVIKVLPPKTVEEILARERERKARTTLLMALPEDHLAKFHKMNDAKEMWDAIKSRFGGNDESKKMQKFQSLLSQLEIRCAGVSTEDANQKFLRSLPSSWSQVSLVMRTKPRVDSLSFDDLYNNLRVFKSDVKGSTRSSSSAQNVAFVSSESTSSTNDVSTAYGDSTSAVYNSQRENSSSYTDELTYSFFANQSSSLQLDHEDMEQLDEFDLEEMDLKWQVVMILIRLKKFYKKTDQKAIKKAEEEMQGTLDIEQKIMGGDMENRRNLKICNLGSDTKVKSCSKECVESYAKLKKLYSEQREQLGDASIEIQAYTQALAKKLLAEAVKEKEELKTKLENFQSSSKGRSKLLNSQMSTRDKSRSSDVEDSPVHDRFANVKGMHAVPPPMARNYISGPDREVDDSMFTYGLKHSKTSESNTQTSNFDSLIRILYKSDSDDEYVIQPLKEQENLYLSHLIRDCDFHEKKSMAKQLNEQKEGKGYCQRRLDQFNTARQNLSSQAATTSTARKVNTARPIVNEIRPRNNFYKSHSPIRRPFNRTTTPRTKFSNQKVNTAGDKAVSAVGGIRETADNPQRALKNKGIVDSGCSRHMTGNKAYLAEYQDYNGGPVAFGGSKGYITGKDTECLVLSSDFKLPDENQVLLRIPRQNNMYSFNLENIVPSGGKFEGKSDEGFLVGYSLNSKAFRVYNLETKRVEENLHINFLENKPNVVGKGPNWLFDLDYLTDSMNYQPVRSENQANKTAGPEEANHSAGTQDNIDAGNSKIEADPAQDYFVLPICSSYTSTVKSSEAKNEGEKPNKDTGLKTNEEPGFAQEAEDLLLQAGAARATSTNTVNTASPSHVFMADFTNLESTVNVSPIPTSKIHFIHPTTQILGDPKLEVQTRSKVNKSSGAYAFVSYIQKQRRNNHKDFQHCLFACFLSQIEPKKIFEALEDECWVDAIQEELNKKDERGVVVRIKARLVAHGHMQEEGIDYDEVFAPVARIKAIRIFLAFASYMGFIVYQMDVKSAFLYGTINENVFQVTPKTSHLYAVKRIFRYLKGKPKLGLSYPRESSFDLVAYSDSDYGGANLDRKSTTRGCQFLGHRLISWQCKKQTIVATSTIEADLQTAMDKCINFLKVNIWNGSILNLHLFQEENALAIPRQTATCKESSNPLMADSLPKTIQSNDPPLSRGYTLGSGEDSLKLMELMAYCTNLCEFETTALSNMEDGVLGISKTIDRKVKVLVSKASIRRHLKLEDSEGLSSLPNANCFEQLPSIGYVTDSDSLTFQKGHFSPQWKFFIHTILHCLSPKKTAWDQFSSNLATTIICLATNRIFNFFKFLFEAMVKNIDSQHKFLMYPRITSSSSLSPQTHQPSPSPHPINTTHRIEEPTQMPHELPLYSVYSLGRDKGSLSRNELTILYTSLSKKVASLESKLKQTKETYSTALTKLILRVKKLERQVQNTNSRRKTRIVLSEDEDAVEDPSNQGRIIEEIDVDTNIILVTTTKVSSQSDQSEDHLRVLCVAKVLAEAAKQGRSVGLTQTYTRRRRNVGTSSGGVSTASELDSIAGGKAKDKGKEIMQEPKPLKKLKKRVQVQMSMDEEIAKKMFEEEQAKLDAREEVPSKATQAIQEHEIDWNDPSVLRYHAQLNRPYSVAEVRKDMIMYLKNQGGYKMSYFKERPREDKIKRQKTKDDPEKLTLKEYVQVVSNSKEAINVIPLAVKSLMGDMKIMFDPDENDYIPASPDYVLTSPGKTYSSSSNNSFGLVPIASPTLSLFHDDPNMKVMHAYYAKELPIPPPIIVPPSSMLSPMIANLEQIIKDIQARHQADKESLLNAIYEHKNSQEGPSDY